MSADVTPLNGPTKDRVFVDRTESLKDGIWYLYEIVDMRCPKCHMRTTVAISTPDSIMYAHVIDDVTRWHVMEEAILPDDPKFWRFLFEIGEDAP